MTVLIGNSDNKLTQAEWSVYCFEVSMAIKASASQIFFQGGSSWDSPFQNACWCFEVDLNAVWDLGVKITEIRQRFHQDSVAVISGKTSFI